MPGPAPTRTATPPAQLPPDVYGFTGREAHLHELDSLRTQTPLRPVAIDGMAGIGKPNPGN